VEILIFVAACAYGLFVFAALGYRGRVLRAVLTAAIAMATMAAIYSAADSFFGARATRNEWYGLYMLPVLLVTAASVIPVVVVARLLGRAWVPDKPSVPPSRRLLELAGLLAATIAVWHVGPKLMRQWDTSRADTALAHGIVYPEDRDYGVADTIATPRAQNKGLPRALIRLLRGYPKDRARKPHNPDNRGLLEALRILGASRDPDGPKEVLVWVHGDAAPDVRRAAVRALAGTGHREILPVMDTLLPEAERLFDRDPSIRYGNCTRIVKDMQTRTDRRLPPEFSTPRGCDVFVTPQWLESAEALSLAADTPVGPDTGR
jgi:GNAT superfamily N-acetyltransferase